uniref:Uncharacterized protein n=1 Tax=Rhizophora mucronata TaxID=61149 RepID=A0A2P2KQY7_RHIMU
MYSCICFRDLKTLVVEMLEAARSHS